METIVIIVGSGFFTAVLLTLYMRRTLNNILTQVGQDVGEQFTLAVGSIGDSIKEQLTDPNVKRAMSILGKQSGEVRLNKAAENAMATAVLDNVAPEYRIILDRIAPNFLEQYGPEQLLPLIQKYGPLLQRFLPKGLGQATQSSEKYGKY